MFKIFDTLNPYIALFVISNFGCNHFSLKRVGRLSVVLKWGYRSQCRKRKIITDVGDLVSQH